MHINWRGLLGGVLEGVLPNPGFSADALLQGQIFGRRAMSGTVPDDAQFIVQIKSFGPRPHWVPMAWWPS